MGTVGLTEEEAISLYGSEVVDCYTSEFEPLEWNLRHEEREEDVVCYIKIVVNKLEDNKVIGMHIAAPNAGEIIQGFALAFRLGITHKVKMPLLLFALSLFIFSVTVILAFVLKLHLHFFFF